MKNLVSINVLIYKNDVCFKDGTNYCQGHKILHHCIFFIKWDIF